MLEVTMFAFDLGWSRVSLLVTDKDLFLQRLRTMAGITAVSSHLSELVLEFDGSKTPEELLKEIRQLGSYTSFKIIPLLPPPPRVARVE